MGAQDKTTAPQEETRTFFLCLFVYEREPAGEGQRERDRQRISTGSSLAALGTQNPTWGWNPQTIKI